MAIEKYPDSCLLQQLCALEVMGICRKDDKFTYLVLFDDQKNRFLTSAEAQIICPFKIIDFYTKSCYWEDNKIFVPNEYVIGKLPS